MDHLILIQKETAMRLTTRTAQGLLVATLLLGGCQRLNEERTLSLPAADVQRLNCDPPKYEQKLTVTVTSSPGPVNAYLVLTEDADAGEEALNRGMQPKKVLASQEKGDNLSLEGTIPAGKGFTVLVSNATNKTTEAKVKIKGR
jgi:hypothetical protein